MVLRIKQRENAIQLLAMDPQVCGKLIVLIGEAMVFMQKPSMIGSPSKRLPKKAPRWDLTGTEGCGGGKVVSWLPLIFLGYKSVYRRRNQVRGATRGPRGWGRALPPRGIPHFNSKSSGLLSVQERSSRRFHSVWTPSGIPFLQNSKIGKKKRNWHWAFS